MKLLVITQKVDIDDSNLGFFHHWLEKIAEKVDKLYAICLWEGKHNLPENTEVLSLGKERGCPKIVQLARLQAFLFKHLREVDGVFVHMCPIYAIASFPLAKLFGKKMILWFTHGTVGWKLRMSSRLVDKILTASPESCRLKNREKIEIVGHGIDTDLFHPSASGHAYSGTFNIISAGRISPTKDQETLIKAIDILVNQKGITDIAAKIVGAPLDEIGEGYLKRLKALVKEKKLGGYVNFSGSVPHKDMPEVYRHADLLINLSHTGSIDKVVLEGMASGCLILTCNEAFEDLLEDKYLFQKKNVGELAEKIVSLKSAERDAGLREEVVRNNGLDNLIGKILGYFN